jgi:putative NADH-flavin reductase
MHIAFFGATGGTGREVLTQALAQGHSVAALVRDPAKLADQAGLTKIPGDVLDRDPINRCVAGAEVVVCVLGSHTGQAPVEARGTTQILAVMWGQAIRRIIVVTSLGAGDSRSQLPWGIRLLMDVMLRSMLRAKEEQETLVKATELDRIIVRPGRLTNGRRTGDGFRVETKRAVGLEPSARPTASRSPTRPGQRPSRCAPIRLTDGVPKPRADQASA